MNINFKKNLAFFHIPKCAGKSIMSSFGIEKNGIIGASAGSLFVFKGPYKAVLINYPNSQQKNILYKKVNYENKK